MSDIKILSPELVNKIAAGEVVERPASVVKELLENSLDAGARNVFLEIESGGTKTIRVSDDGDGMERDDALMSLQSHSTSKLHSLDDFNTLCSYGFRGEALASISSVSKFVLETRQKGEIEGTRVSCLNHPSGFDIQIKPAGCAEGTRVCVEDLFFNVPARRKFLKSLGTEYQWILNVFNRVAVFHYGIGFKLIHNKKPVYNLLPVINWKDRVKLVLGLDLADDLIAFTNDKYEIGVSGFLGKPSVAKKNRKGQYLFINGRPVFDPMISRAFKDAYGSLLPRESFPTFLIKLDVPPAWVDVNVHPQKSEVRFMYPQIIFRIINKVVNDTLKENNLVSQSKDNFFQTESSTQNSFAVYKKSGVSKPSVYVKNPSFSGFVGTNEKVFSKIRDNAADYVDINSDFSLDRESFFDGEWKVLGQIHKAFILVESPKGLLVIDQHAAAERVTYQKLKQNFQKVRMQQLLLPIVFDVGLEESSIIENNKEILTKSGFDLISFGPQSFQLAGVPMELSKYNIKDMILGLITDLQNSEFANLDSSEDKKDLIYKYAACRGSIKFQDSLHVSEMEALVSDIKKYKVYTCPHGRPALVEFGIDELCKKFYR